MRQETGGHYLGMTSRRTLQGLRGKRNRKTRRAWAFIIFTQSTPCQMLQHERLLPGLCSPCKPHMQPKAQVQAYLRYQEQHLPGGLAVCHEARNIGVTPVIEKGSKDFCPRMPQGQGWEFHRHPYLLKLTQSTPAGRPCRMLLPGLPCHTCKRHMRIRAQEQAHLIYRIHTCRRPCRTLRDQTWGVNPVSWCLML